MLLLLGRCNEKYLCKKITGYDHNFQTLICHICAFTNKLTLIFALLLWNHYTHSRILIVWSQFRRHLNRRSIYIYIYIYIWPARRGKIVHYRFIPCLCKKTQKRQRYQYLSGQLRSHKLPCISKSITWAVILLIEYIDYL